MGVACIPRHRVRIQCLGICTDPSLAEIDRLGYDSSLASA